MTWWRQLLKGTLKEDPLIVFLIGVSFGSVLTGGLMLLIIVRTVGTMPSVPPERPLPKQSQHQDVPREIEELEMDRFKDMLGGK